VRVTSPYGGVTTVLITPVRHEAVSYGMLTIASYPSTPPLWGASRGKSSAPHRPSKPVATSSQDQSAEIASACNSVFSSISVQSMSPLIVLSSKKRRSG
jgi:hypothetical protein